MERVAGEHDVNVDEIIAQLDVEAGQLPEAALRAAQRYREEVTPRLIELIRAATEKARRGEPIETEGHFFALFLLAEFQAKEALPAIIDAISLPGELPFELFGDAITENLPQILAVLGADDWDRLEQLADDPSLNDYVRAQVAHTCFYHVRDGRMSREEAVERLRGHLRAAVAGPSIVYEYYVNGLVSSLMDYAANEALPEIEEAFRRGLVDETIVGDLDEVQQACNSDSDFSQRLANCWPTGIDDAVEELRSWAAFRDDKPKVDESLRRNWDPATSLSLGKLTGEEEVDPHEIEAGETIRNEGIRPGRNEPCPCGSGKKYKKCCGRPGGELL